MQDWVCIDNNKTIHVLRRLYQAEGSYVSGQELCESLGVSRTAVWKIISQLKDLGYEIESVPKRGSRLVSGPDSLAAEKIGALLETKHLGQTLCYFPVTGSTNNEARRLAENGAPDGTLVLADEQRQGKGRRGRAWSTPAGTSIAMSLILRPSISPSSASMLTLVMGMAAASACRMMCGLPVRIKWPNDIVYGGRKLCGILTELSTEPDFINYVVIGIGINCNLDEFPETLKSIATSLKNECGRTVDRAGLAVLCMREFEKYYEIFLKTGDFSALKDEYNDLLAGMGEKVRVLSPGCEHNGVSLGINDMGELCVLLDDGSTERVYAGEVSVRGIYGYV